MARGNDWWRVRGENLIRERGFERIEDPLVDSKGRPISSGGKGSLGVGVQKPQKVKGIVQMSAESYVPGKSKPKVVRAGDPELSDLGQSAIGKYNKKKGVVRSRKNKKVKPSDQQAEARERRQRALQRKKERMAADPEFAAEVNAKIQRNAEKRIKDSKSFLVEVKTRPGGKPLTRKASE